MSYLITTEQYSKLKSTIEDLLAPFDSVGFSDFVATSPIKNLVVKKTDKLVPTHGYSISLNYLEQHSHGFLIEAFFDISDNQNIIAINSDAQPINLLKNPSFTRMCSICNTTTNRSKGLIFSHPHQGDSCAHLACVNKRLPELSPFAHYLAKLPQLHNTLSELQLHVFDESYADGIPLRLYLAIVENEIRQHGFVSKQDAIKYHHDFSFATFQKAKVRYQAQSYSESLPFEFVEKALLYTQQLKSTDFNDKLKSLAKQTILAPHDLATATLIVSNYIVNNQGLVSHQSPLATSRRLQLHNDGSDISESVRLKGKLGDYVFCNLSINSCNYQSITNSYDVRGKDDLGRVVQFNFNSELAAKRYIRVSGIISKFYKNQYGYTVTVLKGCKLQK